MYSLYQLIILLYNKKQSNSDYPWSCDVNFQSLCFIKNAFEQHTLLNCAYLRFKRFSILDGCLPGSPLKNSKTAQTGIKKPCSVAGLG
jgi:hypothetical protein